jgi:hypothetical protein
LQLTKVSSNNNINFNISNISNNNVIRSFPLIPHHVEWERRRRERRFLGDPINMDNHNYNNNHNNDDDCMPPRHRRQKAQQVGALYQGYGTHYVDLWCGSPSPQRQTVIVDTGSGVTAFPCSGCRDCGVPNYHIDELFHEDQSTTFRHNTCSDRGDCVADRSTCSLQKSCSITMSYAEGSRWSAYEGIDRCYVAGPHEIPLLGGTTTTDNTNDKNDLDPNHASDLAFDLIFGCQTVVTGLFKSQLADGIMGMSDSKSTYWAQMYQAHQIQQKAFSLCFSRPPFAEREGTEAGAMTLGGVDTRLHLTPMVFTPAATKAGARSGFFNVRVRRVMLREGPAGESAQSLLQNPNQGIRVLDVSQKVLNTGGVIVDSGTTDTYWNRGIQAEFNNAFSQITQRKHDNNAWELTHEELLALPTILFQLESDLEDTNPHIDDAFHTVGMAGALDPQHPSDIILALPPSHYMEYDEESDTYTSRFYPTEGRGSVLGANAIMGHDVFFDIDNQRIGWAESSCDYTKLVHDSGYDFDITGEIQDPQPGGGGGGGEPSDAPEGGGDSDSSDCESYSSGAKCQSAEGCSWYWGKCTKNNDAPKDTAAPTTISNDNDDEDDDSVEENKQPDIEPAHNPGADRPLPDQANDDEISKFLDECNSPACRYPVLFGLLIALLVGCCLSYCFLRLCNRAGGDQNERYKYTRAQAQAIEIEMSNGDHAIHGVGALQLDDGNGAFRDDEPTPKSSSLAGTSPSLSSNGSYRDDPVPGETHFSDEPEFEGDFA